MGNRGVFFVFQFTLFFLMTVVCSLSSDEIGYCGRVEVFLRIHFFFISCLLLLSSK
ncbi:MAG: hypothetical protein J3R72DRAFT_437236 [Linnemannia gamsii]|nr:MAG: hypothetical protein J3R72DRAFT_437236 [Linnemannia gamsii]